VILNKRRYQSINQSSLSSREITVFNMSTAILHNTFKTTTSLNDATVNETLPLSDYRSLQFFHRVKFSPDSLLEGITNSNSTGLRSGLFFLGGGTCQAWWSRRSFSDVPRAMARRLAEVHIYDDGFLLGCQTTNIKKIKIPGLDSSSLLGAVDLCASTELIWAKFEMVHSIDISSSVVFC